MLILPPLLKDSVAAPLLSAYYPDCVGMSPSCTSTHRSLGESNAVKMEHLKPPPTIPGKLYFLSGFSVLAWIFCTSVWMLHRSHFTGVPCTILFKRHMPCILAYSYALLKSQQQRQVPFKGSDSTVECLHGKGFPFSFIMFKLGFTAFIVILKTLDFYTRKSDVILKLW